MNSIRVVLSVCAADEYRMKQLDADTALLNSKLKDRVYMKVPFSIENARDYPCQLNKGIYGLKQAASAWNKTIHRVFLGNGFNCCGADQCVYVKHSKNGFIYENAKPVDNPCAPGLKLSKTQSPGTDAEQNAMRSKPYRSRIGRLLYITTRTRPGIAFVVTQLSRFLENSGQQHWNAAVCVLRYLKSSRQHGIIYQGGAHSVTLKAYSDADWGTNLDDRRYVSGVTVMIRNAPVVFKSKFQRTVALSSAEVEYMALSVCVQEALENVERGTVKVEYVNTKNQLADILNKALGTKTLKFLRDGNGIKEKITVP
ncbi:hypothetical protein PR001_g16424 [Phytophthora rubi]|uniref:Reverse transcriptase Ty1/copia-type domain-containing protein n=1 Tax=Phytophthora rubi TaxID=129364 RepID=A0A6A3KVD6_9STRA|nr:hypothetical protein PR001_g16424 [Phytophthora rubi]